MSEAIALIPSLISASTSIIEYIAKVRLAAQQAGEWTLALEDEFQGLLDAAKTNPAWQPDPPATPPTV